MDDYPPNSRTRRVEKDRPDKRPAKKVVSAAPVQRQKSLGRRVRDTFLGDGGSSQGILSYIGREILLPAARDMVADAITGGANRALYGSDYTPRRSGSARLRSNERVNYNQRSNLVRRDDDRREPLRARTTSSVDELVFETHADCVDVITEIYDALAEYDTVSKLDVLGWCGITGTPIDDKWGWTADMLVGLRPISVKGGFLLDLPRPIEID